MFYQWIAFAGLGIIQKPQIIPRVDSNHKVTSDNNEKSQDTFAKNVIFKKGVFWFMDMRGFFGNSCPCLHTILLLEMSVLIGEIIRCCNVAVMHWRNSWGCLLLVLTSRCIGCVLLCVSTMTGAELVVGFALKHGWLALLQVMPYCLNLR